MRLVILCNSYDLEVAMAKRTVICKVLVHSGVWCTVEVCNTQGMFGIYGMEVVMATTTLLCKVEVA